MNNIFDKVGLIRGYIVETVSEAGKLLKAKFSGRGEEVVEDR